MKTERSNFQMSNCGRPVHQVPFSAPTTNLEQALAEIMSEDQNDDDEAMQAALDAAPVPGGTGAQGRAAEKGGAPKSGKGADGSKKAGKKGATGEGSKAVGAKGVKKKKEDVRKPEKRAPRKLEKPATPALLKKPAAAPSGAALAVVAADTCC